MRDALPRVGLHESGVQLQALVQIPEGVGVGEQFRESRGTIRVEFRVLRVPFDRLVVLLLCLRPITCLERRVALFLVLLRHFRVKVRLFIVLILRALRVLERDASLAVVVLRHGFVVIFDGIVELFPPLKDGCHPAINLRHLLERCTARVGAINVVTALEQVLACIQNIVVIFRPHFDPHGALIVVVDNVVRLCRDSLVVHRQGLLELPLFVKFIALGLVLVRFLGLW
mmetsp:Transcript_69100/g.192327  ORF Transcript_69100/g.192327 Transcript_69100/m.192327 type:complete len:228 (+) Transcript_69100:413-1096(+)